MSIKHDGGDQWYSSVAIAVGGLLRSAQDGEASGDVSKRVKIGRFARYAGKDMPDDLTVDLLGLLTSVGYKPYAKATVNGLTHREQNAGIVLSLYAVAPRGSYAATGESMGVVLANMRASDSRWNQEPASFEGVLTPIMRADSKEALVWALKNAIRRVNPDSTKIDYPLLVDDLYRFDNGDKIIVKWARDYYAQDYKNHSAKEAKDSKEN